MQRLSLEEELRGNAYPGRGIVVGVSEDGAQAVTAYFIMGRSENSRNRVFVTEQEGIRTQAWDPSKMQDPSLIIYSPVRVLDDYTIVTNGDQTDTVYEGLRRGLTFEEALEARTFEPDAPNYTPRISALLRVSTGTFNYRMSILKTEQGDPSCCVRQTFFYDQPQAGCGSFLHTYARNEEPLPAFEGEPKPVKISGDIDAFSRMIWDSLNEENKVSLFVRYIDIQTGSYQTRIINKNN